MREDVIKVEETNPLTFSNCGNRLARRPPELLDGCDAKHWQVGLGAAQVFNNAAQWESLRSIIADYARKIGKADRPEKEIETDILQQAAHFAHLDDQANAIANLPEGRVRTAWLLRHPVIGMADVDYEVHHECFSSERRWERECFNTRYPAAKKFAPNRASAGQSVQDLEEILAGFRSVK